MKKNSSVRVILTCLAIMLFAGMAMGSSFFQPLGEGGLLTEDEKKEYDEAAIEKVNNEIMHCTGFCLTYEEMVQKVSDYEKIQAEYSNKEIKSESQHTFTVPDLKLIMMPGDQELEDKSNRYKISVASYDGGNVFGFIESLKVEIMDDDEVSECEIEDPKPQEQTETTAGLPAKEIEGAYTCASVLKVNMKGKDEDEPWTEIYSEELTFTYNVFAIDEKTVRIDLETVKFGEGPYDPATGVCEFQTAPEFYEVFTTAKHDDYTQRFTFSRKGDKIQLEGIVVGKEDDDSVTVGIKEG